MGAKIKAETWADLGLAKGTAASHFSGKFRIMSEQ